MVVLPETEQEVFNKVAAHLMSQRVKSSDRARCLYRNGELKCAAGCLIPDEQYDPCMEGLGWEGLIMDGLVGHEHAAFIIHLQRIHDFISPSKWLNSLTLIAKHRCLDPSILENYTAIEE